MGRQHGSSRPKGSGRDVAARLGQTLAEATAAASAFRSGWQRSALSRDPRDRMALEHERQQRQYQRDVQRHSSRVARLRARSQYLAVAAVAAVARSPRRPRAPERRPWTW